MVITTELNFIVSLTRIIELSIGDLLGKAMLSEEIKSGDNVTILPGTGKGEFSWEKE